MINWTLDVFVAGQPRPQGSKRARPICRGRGDAKVFTGKVAQVESSKHVGSWRERVAFFAVQASIGVPPIERMTPVFTWIEFVMPRPTSAPKKTTPPAIRQPDLDKCLRAINDALTGIAWIDDAQVVRTMTSKRIAEPGETPGCRIRVEPDNGPYRLDIAYMDSA